MKYLPFFILLAGMMVACGPAAEEVAATYFAEQTIEAATDTPHPPTSTPLPTFTPRLPARPQAPPCLPTPRFLLSKSKIWV
jgi:hypothetical protein